MKITVLSGSYKGEYSGTLQYLNYVKKVFPQHEYTVFHVSQQIHKIEKDPAFFSSIVESMKTSDAVMWVFPLYVFLVPAAVKEFIEKLFASGAGDALAGKYTTALTTSVHFFDHTAHNYIQGISEDLGMRFVRGFSAEMNDLLKPAPREQLTQWARLFFDIVEKKTPVEKVFEPIGEFPPEYAPGDVQETAKTGNKKIVLITDARPDEVNLNRMIDVFVKCCPNPVDVLNINDVNIKGGCVSCYTCLIDPGCSYKDDFVKTYEERVMTADGIVFAGMMKDRYLSSRWKMFFDRSFFNGHRPVLSGRKTAWIISGPLRKNSNLREAILGHEEVGQVYNAGVVTDEDDSPRVTALLDALARDLVRAVDENISRQPSFLGVGGHKIFRDMIFKSSYIFKRDFEYYREHDLLDFPHLTAGDIFNKVLFGIMFSIPAMKKEFSSKSNKLKNALELLLFK